MSDTRITGRYEGTGNLTAPMHDASIVGAVLGNYRIIGVLSAGGMGSVYRAQHELLDRPAAIKLLRPELTANDELVQRFFTEAKAATAIRHPGIVEVYDFGYTEAGHAYIVMEFLDGEPLSRALTARGAYPELEAASIARGIASALKAAHAKGIIHRDLKPDNIFIVPDPDGRESRVKVLDFGIAKLANPPTTDGRRRTQTGVLMGTPKYMAPEQAREAGTIDHRADLYSLGCILYELLAGEPPFAADGAGEVIAMQLFNAPEPIAQRASVTPEMNELVMRLLAKDPSERPASARDVMDALVAIGARMSGPHALDSSSFRASQETRAQFSHADHVDTIPSRAAELTTVDPPRKRSRMPFIAAGLAIAVAAATIAFFATRKHDEPAAPAATVQPPAPTVAEPVKQPVVDPPPAPPVVEVVAPETGSARKPRVVKVKTEPPKSAPAKTEEAKPPKAETPPKLKTENQSPIEIDVGDPVKQPKAPS